MCAHSQRQAGKQQQSIHLPLKKPKRYKFCPEINLPLFLSLSFATSLLQPLTPSRVYLFIYLFFSAKATTDTTTTTKKGDINAEQKGRLGFDGIHAGSAQEKQMLLGLAPWGPPVPTLYLLMNTICRLPRGAGTDAVFSISHDKSFKSPLPLCK